MPRTAHHIDKINSLFERVQTFWTIQLHCHSSNLDLQRSDHRACLLDQMQEALGFLTPDPLLMGQALVDSFALQPQQLKFQAPT